MKTSGTTAFIPRQKLRTTLVALTPNMIMGFREHRESPYIFRDVTPHEFCDWEDLYPGW